MAASCGCCAQAQLAEVQDEGLACKLKEGGLLSRPAPCAVSTPNLTVMYQVHVWQVTLHLSISTPNPRS